MTTDRMLLLVTVVNIINNALDGYFDNDLFFKDNALWYNEMFSNTSETRYFCQCVTDEYGYIELEKLHDYDEKVARDFLNELLIVVAKWSPENADIVTRLHENNSSDEEEYECDEYDFYGIKRPEERDEWDDLWADRARDVGATLW